MRLPPPNPTRRDSIALAAARLVEGPLRVAGAAVVVAAIAASGALRHVPGELRGDEATFVAMTASLVRDGDLRFDAADEAWARSRPLRPAALILQTEGDAVHYSKPVLYPLLGAPFYAIGGDTGLRLFNLLVVGAALALVAAALRRRAGSESARETVELALLASPAVVYLAWRMTESLQFALAAAGLALALGGGLGAATAGGGRLQRLLDSRGAAWTGAALLGLLVALREPNAAIAAVPPLAALLGRRPARAVALATASALAYGAVVAVTLAATGAPNPYKALRSTFTAETGYPVPGAEAPRERFVSEFTATSSLGAVPRWAPRESLYAALYFVVGRHAGLIAYFPAALVLLAAAALAGTDRTGRAALAGAAAAALFYLVWWPSNYMGGETVIGNRYFLAAFPALLLVPRRLPSKRLLGAGWLVAAGFAVSALVSVARTGALDRGSQSHAYAGLFRLLPYESVASNVDGRRDRYWHRDFVRFVDPFARVEATSFELEAGAPAAELELATVWDASPVRFLVTSASPRVELVVSDWLRRERFRLVGPGGGGVAGPIAFGAAPAWRQHRFWWPARVPYQVRLVRLRLESPDGAPARARLRYLGPSELPTAGFEREVVVATLPDGGTSGTPGEARVELVHRGGWTWSARGPVPVRLALRFEPIEGEALRAGAVEHRAPLPRDVAPGERVAIALPFLWPPQPGRWRARLDLVLEDVAWFGDRTGGPIVEREVRVTRAEAAAPSAPADPRGRTEP